MANTLFDVIGRTQGKKPPKKAPEQTQQTGQALFDLIARSMGGTPKKAPAQTTQPGQGLFNLIARNSAFRKPAITPPAQPNITTPAAEAAAPALQIVGETGTLGLSKSRKSSKRRGSASTLLGGMGGAYESFGG